MGHAQSHPHIQGGAATKCEKLLDTTWMSRPPTPQHGGPLCFGALIPPLRETPPSQPSTPNPDSTHIDPPRLSPTSTSTGSLCPPEMARPRAALDTEQDPMA